MIVHGGPCGHRSVQAGVTTRPTWVTPCRPGSTRRSLNWPTCALVAQGIEQRFAKPTQALTAGWSAAEALECDQDSLDTARSKPALHIRRRDRLELPAMGGMFVEDPLQLVARHLAADHLFPKLHNLVFIPFGHDPIVHQEVNGRVAQHHRPVGAYLRCGFAAAYRVSDTALAAYVLGDADSRVMGGTQCRSRGTVTRRRYAWSTATRCWKLPDVRTRVAPSTMAEPRRAHPYASLGV